MALGSSVGLVSGLNYNDIITKLIALDARPVQQLQVKQQTLQRRQAALQTINKAILDLQTSVGNLTDESDFDSRNVTVGDSTILTASTSNSASAGTYSVKVLQVATANRIAAQGVATIDSTPIAAGAGSFSFKVGSGAIKTLSVTASTTLTQLRDAINSDSTSGVRASIVSDGTGTNPYRLVLTANSTGAANTITILTNNTTLNFATKSIEAASASSTNAFDGTVTSSGTYTGTGTKNIVAKITTAGANGTAKFAVSTDGGITFGPDNQFTTSTTAQDISGGLGVNIAFAAGTTNFAVGDTFGIDAFDPNLQKANDAVLEIDGVQIRRSTNTVADAIDGVTINALKADATGTTISVQNNNQNVNGLVQSFVSSYNGLISAIDNVASFDTTTNSGGILFGDSAVSSIRSTISTIASSAVAGLSSNNSLGAIGVKLGSDGKLTIDSAKLSDALSNNFDTVKRIFAEVGSTTSTGINFTSSTTATAAGTYDVNITRPAEQATITGAQAVASSGISADETLTFTSNGKTVNAVITAGTKIADAVSRLNQIFNDQGLTLNATQENGALKIQSVSYGSSETFSVVSNQSGATNAQLGIGTTTLTDTGVDVGGTIAGLSALGKGQLLSGAIGSHVEGLKLTITSASVVTGKVTISKGVAKSIAAQLDSITNSTNGLIKTKNDSLDDSIKSIGDDIDRLNQRLSKESDALKTQFTNLETTIATLQSQGNALLAQLASLPVITK